MSQEIEPVGCYRAHLKPGQELPELAKAIQEGRVVAVVNGKRVVPQQP